MSELEPENKTVERLLEVGCRERCSGHHAAALASFEAAAALDGQRLGIKVELAHELRMLGRVEEAERVLAGVLDEDPTNASAHIERGHLFRHYRDSAQAAESFAAAARIEPDNLPLRLELVRELRALGSLEEAERELDALEPGSALVAVERGLLRRRRGDPVGAGFAFAAAATALPDNLDVRLELARELRAAGFLHDAEAVLRAVLAADSRHVEALVERALLSRRRGDRAGALAGFARAAEADPRHVRVLVELAYEHKFAGEPAAAAAALERALAVSPFDFPALMALAEQALHSGDAERAARLAETARERHPGEIAAYLLGARAQGQADCNAAEAILEEAQARFGATAAIAATRLHVLRLHRNLPAANRVVAAHTQLIGRDRDLWGEATALAIAQGDFDGAERALAAPPVDVEGAVAAGLRGQLAQARRDYAAAIHHYTDALAHGLRPQWRVDLAQCCLLVGDVETADRHLRASLAWPEADHRVANVSQHHLGQLLNEVRLDRELSARLHELDALALAAQVELLADLVRQNPDFTGASLLLLSALRRAGRFDAPRRSAESGCPRRIAQYWHAAPPPPDVAALMATWRDAHPDHEYRLFDNRTAWEFLDKNVSAEAARAFQRALDTPQRADIFRLGFLAAEGGVFVDADDRCLTPLPAEFESHALVVYQETLGNLGANVVAAAPGHPFVLRALALAVDAVNRGDHDIVWLSTGPGLLTRAFAQEWASGRDDALVLETHALHRIVGVHCPADYKRRRRGP